MIISYQHFQKVRCGEKILFKRVIKILVIWPFSLGMLAILVEILLEIRSTDHIFFNQTEFRLIPKTKVNRHYDMYSILDDTKIHIFVCNFFVGDCSASSDLEEMRVLFPAPNRCLVHPLARCKLIIIMYNKGSKFTRKLKWLTVYIF